MSQPLSSAVTGAPQESSSSAVSWGPILAGTLAATAITLIFMLIGSGLGLTMISPFAGGSSSLATIGATAAVWLIVVQWASSALGGYITGRLRSKWVGVHTYEVFFRDTAHGFLAWALATLIVVGLLGSAISSLASAGASATATAVGATAAVGGAGAAAAASNSDSAGGFSTSYFTDALLRPADGRSAPQNQSNEAVSAEISRVLINGAAQGGISADDRAYLDQVERRPAWMRFAREIAQRLYLAKAQREYELLALDAAQRYRLALERWPQLERYCTQRAIASYIGITPVHLSRLRRLQGKTATRPGNRPAAPRTARGRHGAGFRYRVRLGGRGCRSLLRRRPGRRCVGARHVF